MKTRFLNYSSLLSILFKIVKINVKSLKKKKTLRSHKQKKNKTEQEVEKK